jgi:micrococcal nuclease
MSERQSWHGAHRQPRKGRWPRGSGRGRPRFRAAELRIMLLGGLFAGFAWQVGAASHGGAAVPAAQAEVPVAVSSMTAVRVIDGDTFDYAGERIRIADIDTPELHARCDEEARLAAAATLRLRALLSAGPFELHRLGRDEDRYGRKLRVVVRGGRSLGDVLVAEGLARTWTGRREPWC